MAENWALRGMNAYQSGRDAVGKEQLAGLAQQYARDPSQREAVGQQIAAINPEAAQNLAKYFNGQEEARNTKMTNIARGVLSFKEPEAQRLFYQNTIMPAAQRGGLALDPWDDATTPQTLQGYLAMGQGGQGREGRVVGSALVDPMTGEEMYRAPANTQLVDVPDGRGGQIKMLYNPQTQEFSQPVYGQPGQATPAPISAGSPAQGSGLGYTPPEPEMTPYQRASLDIQRQRLGQSGNSSPSAPSGYRFRGDGSLEPIPGGPQDPSRPRPLSAAEQRDAQTRSTKAVQARNLSRGLQRVQQALAGLSGGMVNTGPLDQYATRFTERGQELEAAVGSIQNSLLSLTRVPGIGSQSDLEARIAMLQYPSLDKPPEVNARTMRGLQAFAEDLMRAYDIATAEDQQSTPQPAQQPGGGWSIKVKP